MKTKTPKYYYDEKHRYIIKKDFSSPGLLFHNLHVQDYEYNHWFTSKCLYGRLDRHKVIAAARALLIKSEELGKFYVTSNWDEIDELIKKYQTGEYDEL